MTNKTYSLSRRIRWMAIYGWPTALSLLILAAPNALAGYFPAPAAAQAQTDGAAVVPQEWRATIIREDGSALSMKEQDGRFTSVDLNPLESCRISITSPLIEVGTVVMLESTHGGKIKGLAKTRLKATESGKISFAYQVGRYGGHPLIIKVKGRSVTMVFHVEAQVPPRYRNKGNQEVAP
ncbi:MAG: hypothetical protein AB7T27_00430 [Kiritimatiellia bacterium]